eukprot:SAG31_NODE_13670_length_854_cov_1.092715_1_plen_73_part_00
MNGALLTKLLSATVPAVLRVREAESALALSRGEAPRPGDAARNFSRELVRRPDFKTETPELSEIIGELVSRV